MSITLQQIAQTVGGELSGPADLVLTGVAPAAAAGPGDLTFAENAEYLTKAELGKAAAILVPKGLGPCSRPCIQVKDVRVAMARLLPLFAPVEEFEPGIAPGAVVHPTAQVDPTAHIGPHCVIGPQARVGARTVLMGGNHVGRAAVVGSQVTLHPNVVIGARCVVMDRVIIHASTVIGSDGYGYVLDAGRHRKVPQIGNVVIHADVEIGSNASIDRAALGTTEIGEGTKIDNLVHVAHNVSIGRHCLIMGQVGFAGSTRLGDYCVIASQSGIAGHLTLGNQATVGAKSGVMRDVPDKGTVLGIPAMPDRQTKRQWIAVQQLPDMLRKLRELEERLTSGAT